MDRAPCPALVVLDDLGAAGLHRAALAQAAALDRHKFRVEIASLERSARDDLAAACWDAGLPAHRLRHRREARPRAWVRLMGLVRRSKPCIVHTHGTAAGVLGRTVARLARVSKVVSTLNEVEPWLGGPMDRLDRLDRTTLSLCDRIVAASDTVRTAVARACPELEGRLVRVYPGVEPLAPLVLAERRVAARASLEYSKEQFVVGVGPVECGADVETLIHGAALAKTRLPKLQLLVVGSDRHASNLETLAAGLRLDRVRFVGDPQELHDCLPAMDVFAWPSRRETCAVEIMQALGAGTPVLATANVSPG